MHPVSLQAQLLAKAAKSFLPLKFTAAAVITAAAVLLLYFLNPLAERYYGLFLSVFALLSFLCAAVSLLVCLKKLILLQQHFRLYPVFKKLMLMFKLEFGLFFVCTLTASLHFSMQVNVICLALAGFLALCLMMDFWVGAKLQTILCPESKAQG